MRELIFVDTETTGLDPAEDSLVELTWARRTGDPKTLWFGVKQVPEFIDNFIGFTKRGLSGRESQWGEFHEFFVASDGNTMVAANPAFDKAFLDKAGLFNFHYRMLDVEAFAMAKLRSPEMPSMKNIFDILTARKHKLAAPDHTSRNDVLAMREAFHILEKM